MCEVAMVTIDLPLDCAEVGPIAPTEQANRRSWPPATSTAHTTARGGCIRGSTPIPLDPRPPWIKTSYSDDVNRWLSRAEDYGETKLVQEFRAWVRKELGRPSSEGE